VPHWAFHGEVLDRILNQLRRAVDAAEGVGDADGLRDVAAALALLDRLGDHDFRGKVNDVRGELVERIGTIMLRYQSAEPADPAAMVALVEALALIDGTLS
jgi:hypothetical protein